MTASAGGRGTSRRFGPSRSLSVDDVVRVAIEAQRLLDPTTLPTRLFDLLQRFDHRVTPTHLCRVVRMCPALYATILAMLRRGAFAGASNVAELREGRTLLASAVSAYSATLKECATDDSDRLRRDTTQKLRETVDSFRTFREVGRDGLLGCPRDWQGCSCASKLLSS